MIKGFKTYVNDWKDCYAIVLIHDTGKENISYFSNYDKFRKTLNLLKAKGYTYYKGGEK